MELYYCIGEFEDKPNLLDCKDACAENEQCLASYNNKTADGTCIFAVTNNSCMNMAKIASRFSKYYLKQSINQLDQNEYDICSGGWDKYISPIGKRNPRALPI